MPDRTIICPPEWDPQSAVWVGWPRLEAEWGEAFAMARLEIAGFVRALSQFIAVRLAVGDDAAADDAYAMLGDAAEIHRVPSGDIWLRDTGPLFGLAGDAPSALTFRFNGWGGKYVMDGDTGTAAALCELETVTATPHDFVLEGGAIEQDGAGALLTTRQCLLNENRNPSWTEDIADAALKDAFGADRIIWLEDGLTGDHTDGHIDNIARFVAPGHVLCQSASGINDPNAERLAEIEATLRATGLEVSTLPSPGRIQDEAGAVLPASHMNFLITNGAVLMPAFENDFSVEAAAMLSELFPGRDVLALPARHILSGGGAFHCMTQQVPDWPQLRKGPTP
ncbi:MAG: agmatine deiminase family protein [Pseudomonadota bacterium]